ncbi:unnamed protein product [Rotaria sp. Silwood2]|nr:unnamed protein product [Rotaria sp. Silwood2]CAF2636141.1 unnamed protein product [Rotaria sp. Silwood2]CAF2924656.1 unnamed protein product [Rotaria sp. Silwood2]CAF3052570.1 unnamed protein product [Rotaria sp. Silwood2]CAF3928417.1 unnamed protein product [Rotaria sp. Silwood2]
MTKKNPSKQSSKSHKKSKNDGVGKQADAYRIFFVEQQTHRIELSSMSTKEQMKILRTEWRKLSAQQKQAYKVKATNEINHQVLDKKELTSNRIHSGTKTNGNNKHHSHGKSPSQKKTCTKKTKRMNQKLVTRKTTNHEQHDQIEGHETVENTHE